MRKLAPIAVVLALAALGAGSLVLLAPSTEVEPMQIPPVEPPPPLARPAAPAPSARPMQARPARPQTPAPGRAFRADRERPNSTAGQIEPQPPADAATWQQRREAMEAEWEGSTLAAARRFAAEQGLEPAEEAAMIGILERMHGEVSQLRTDLGSGAVLPMEARRQLTAIRAGTTSAMVGELGANRAAALRAHLAKEVRGAGF